VWRIVLCCTVLCLCCAVLCRWGRHSSWMLMKKLDVFVYRGRRCLRCLRGAKRFCWPEACHRHYHPCLAGWIAHLAVCYPASRPLSFGCRAQRARSGCTSQLTSPLNKVGCGVRLEMARLRCVNGETCLPTHHMHHCCHLPSPPSHSS